jgi:hypothetical protein
MSDLTEDQLIGMSMWGDTGPMACTGGEPASGTRRRRGRTCQPTTRCRPGLRPVAALGRSRGLRGVKLQAAIEGALGRVVFTHEFGMDWDGLERELLGERPTPTIDEVMELIPIDKRICLVIDEEMS